VKLPTTETNLNINYANVSSEKGGQLLPAHFQPTSGRHRPDVLPGLIATAAAGEPQQY